MVRHGRRVAVEIEREIKSVLASGSARGSFAAQAKRSSRGAARENMVADLLKLSAAPMTIGELRDAIGGNPDDIQAMLEQAILAGHIRLAESLGEPLFSAVKFEACPTSKVSVRKAQRRPNKTSPSRSGRVSDPVDDVIRAALWLSGGRGRRVMLTDLRRYLPSIGRREFDELLVAMSRDARVALFPNDDRYSITDADVRDAVKLSGVPQHILYLP